LAGSRYTAIRGEIPRVAGNDGKAKSEKRRSKVRPLHKLGAEMRRRDREERSLATQTPLGMTVLLDGRQDAVMCVWHWTLPTCRGGMWGTRRKAKSEKSRSKVRPLHRRPEWRQEAVILRAWGAVCCAPAKTAKKDGAEIIGLGWLWGGGRRWCRGWRGDGGRSGAGRKG